MKTKVEFTSTPRVLRWADLPVGAWYTLANYPDDGDLYLKVAPGKRYHHEEKTVVEFGSTGTFHLAHEDAETRVIHHPEVTIKVMS